MRTGDNNNEAAVTRRPIATPESFPIELPIGRDGSDPVDPVPEPIAFEVHADCGAVTSFW